MPICRTTKPLLIGLGISNRPNIGEKIMSIVTLTCSVQPCNDEGLTMPTRSRQLLVKNYGKWLLNRRVTIGCIILAVTFSMAYSAAAQLTPSPPALLNTNGDSDLGHDYEPQVTTDGTGNWVAVWYSDENLGGTAGTDPDIFVATSTDNGGSWSAPALLNTNGDSDIGLSLIHI